MAEKALDKPIQGKDILYLIQSVDAKLGASPLFPAFQTDGSFSWENDLFDEQTKNGRVLGYGGDSESIEFTYYGRQGDAGQEAIETAIEKKQQMKVWRVNRNKNADGKFDARFAYVLIESREYNDGADGSVEISISTQVLGLSKKGVIDSLPDEILNAANGGYEFQAPGETTGESPGEKQTTP